MKKQTEIMNYIFRSPKLPLLIDSGTRLYCVTGNDEIDINLKDEIFEEKNEYPAIDKSGESFSYSHEDDTVSPLTIKNKNTKKVLIDLYNSRRMEGVAEYSVKSISNTKYPKLFMDIANLVLQENIQGR